MHFPFILLYGLIYAVFSWILFYYRGVFYYFFLNYERKGAVYWYLGLLVGVLVFFVGGWGYSLWLQNYSTNVLPYAVSYVVYWLVDDCWLHIYCTIVSTTLCNVFK